jgi:RimJ/RimL family protein N-acetyltransferase
MSFPRETQRLILRPFTKEDANVFSTYRSDPQVARYQGWNAPFSLEEAEAFIHTMQTTKPGAPGEWFQVAITLKENGQLIGDCAFCVLEEDERQAEMGFTLSRAFQGKGLMTEAVHSLLSYLFDHLNLHRVRAVCDVENTASSRLLERIGMRKEGTFIENIWFKGHWGSEHTYAMLHREWELLTD